MNRVEEIAQITHKIIDNLVAECEWNDKLLNNMTRESFEKLLKERSKAIRGFYTENEILYNTLREYAAQELDEELAGALFESARAFILNGRLDPAFICVIADPLVEYYRQSDDETRAIIITAIRNASRYDFYNRMDKHYKFENTLEAYEWIMSRKDKYAEYEDKRARQNILLAFSQMILIHIAERTDESVSKSLELIEEVNELWERPEVQAVDGADAGTASILAGINGTTVFEYNIGKGNSPQTVNRVVKLMERYCEKNKDCSARNEQLMLKMIEIYKDDVAHKNSARETIAKYMSLLGELPETDWLNRTEESQDILNLYIYLYLFTARVMENSDMDYPEREQNIRNMLIVFKQVVRGMPYRYLTFYVDDMYRTLFMFATMNVTDMDFFEKMTQDLLMSRQISTFLHTQMVENIAVRIAQEIMAQEPALFVGLPNYPDIDSVQNGAEKLLEEIAKSARYHDLGKCNVTPIITRQSRRIMEDEFACIKLHPEIVLEVFDNKEGTGMYTDVMRGHHRTYDGRGGYPDTFDNIASPYRFVIDLIAISDCIDAATDVIGRNYAAGKDFPMLLEEMKGGAGTRYNPNIVRIIANSPELVRDLTRLTGEQRMDYCYEAYKRCLS